MACFATDDGGWILVSNSETLDGGASAVRFGADARRSRRLPHPRRDHPELLGRRRPRGAPGSPARRSRAASSGSATRPASAGASPARPWAPSSTRRQRLIRAAGAIYLTEDLMDGRVYRFTPTRWHDLERRPARGRHGGARTARVSWTRGARPRRAARARRASRCAAARSSSAPRASGTTTERLHLDHGRPPRARLRHRAASRIRVDLRRAGVGRRAAPASRPAHREPGGRGVRVRGHRDRGDRHRGDRPRRPGVAFLSATGPKHAGSELTGVTFDPSGSRMYFSSQRAFGQGTTATGTGRHLRGVRAVSGFTGLSRDGTQRVTTCDLQAFSV